MVNIHTFICFYLDFLSLLCDFQRILFLTIIRLGCLLVSRKLWFLYLNKKLNLNIPNSKKYCRMRLMYAGTVCLFSTWGSRQSSNFLGEEFFFLGGGSVIIKTSKTGQVWKIPNFFLLWRPPWLVFSSHLSYTARLQFTRVTEEAEEAANEITGQ